MDDKNVPYKRVKKGLDGQTLSDQIGTLKETTKSILEYQNLVVNKGLSTENWQPAIQAAIDSLQGLGKVLFPKGEFKASGDVTVPSYVSLEGSGYGTHIKFSGGGIVFNTATKFGLRNLRLSRSGAGGAVIWIGGSATNGSSRFLLDNINITSSTGVGLHIEDSWIGTLINPIIQGCQKGLEFIKGDYWACSMNSLTIIGGEIQGNVVAGDVHDVKGLSMQGLAIEGNTGSGLDLIGTIRDVKFDGCYFEGNAQYDVLIDANPSGGYGVSFDATGFLRASMGASRAIRVKRMNTFRAQQCSFFSYPNPPILIEEYDANSTGVPVALGMVENCRTDSSRVVENNSKSFGELSTVRHNISQTAADGVRTEFPSFVVDIPLEAANDVVFSTITTPANSTGKAYMGVLLKTETGTTITSLASQTAEMTANNLYTNSWTYDLSAYKGQKIVVNFRRIGENGTNDTSTSSVTYLEGKVEFRKGYK